MEDNTQTCKRCILDANVPGISFDSNGVCNNCYLQDQMEKLHPMGEVGQRKLNAISEKIKEKGRNKEYDCVVGVSGGSDSTYMLYLVKKQLGLRPLAVTLDNGWSSEIAVTNLKNITDRLGVDLQTVVLNWEEFKDLQIAFLKSSTPDVEIPTDHAIVAALMRTAASEGIQYIFNGHSFRTEGKIPVQWSYGDWKSIRSIYQRFGKNKVLRDFPKLSLPDYAYYVFVKQIKEVRPLYYIDYRKDKIKELIERELGWKDYGTKHHESIYTRFAMAYWLPKKFNIDKRKVHLSAQIRAGQISRDQALKVMESPAISEHEGKEIREYVGSKLGITQEEMEKIFLAENKTFLDYPSNFALLNRLKLPIRLLYKIVSSATPQSLLAKET